MKFLKAVECIYSAYQEANPDLDTDPFEINNVDGKFNLFIQLYTTDGQVSDLVPLGVIEASEEAEGEYEITECDWCPALVTIIPSDEHLLSWADHFVTGLEIRQSLDTRMEGRMVTVVQWSEQHRVRYAEGRNFREAVANAMKGIDCVVAIPR